MLELIWLIPLLPLVGVLVNGFFGRRMSRRAVGLVACAMVCLALPDRASAPSGSWPSCRPTSGSSRPRSATWMPLGPIGRLRPSLSIPWGFALDPLSAVMLLVVAGVGFLIHVYSIGYMAHEADYARFFVYLNLFMAMMLMLVLGEQPAGAVRRLGGRRPLLLPADRLLLRPAVRRAHRAELRRRRAQGVHRQPHRRLRLPDRHALPRRWSSAR